LSLEELRNSSKVIGAKQVKKAVMKGLAKKVYIAIDAESYVTEPIRALCTQYAVEYQITDTMKTLGDICGIDVGSAAVALIIE